MIIRLISQQNFWTFLGGTPNKSIDQNPQIKYSNLGLYNVKLVTKNQYGSDSLIKQNYVKVFLNLISIQILKIGHHLQIGINLLLVVCIIKLDY